MISASLLKKAGYYFCDFCSKMKVLKFLGIKPTLTVTGQNGIELPDVYCSSYPSEITFNPDFTLNSVENKPQTSPQFHLIPVKLKHYSDNGSKFIYS